MNGSILMEIKNSNFSTFNYGLSKNTSANVLVVLELITSICLLIGNGYIIALIQRGKLLGRSTNIFVFSIASADLLNALISIPSHILSVTYKGELSIYMCKCFTLGSYISKTVVQYTILCMTIEKAMRILCPTKEIVTLARCMFCTSLLWFFAPSFNIWCVVLFTIEESKRDSLIGIFDTTSLSRCVLKPKFNYLHTYYLTIDLVVLFFVPCFSVFVIFMILVQKYFTVLKERLITYFFVIKLLLALYTVITVCQFPLEVIVILDNTKLNVSTSWTLLVNCAVLFSFSRGIWNVCIYCYFRHFFSKKRHLATIRASNNAKRNGFRMTSLNMKNRMSHRPRKETP